MPERGPGAADPARVERPGLEVVWWVADDTEGRAGMALAAHLDPPQPEAAAVRERWRTSGLRMARVPLERLEQIQAATPSIAQRYRQPIGWTPAWTEVFRGRRVGEHPVAIAGARRTLPRGVMRLLARCWPSPAAGSEPLIHLDLAWQCQPDALSKAANPFERPVTLTEDQRGEIITELTLDAAVAPGFAYLITCEAPATEWLTRRVEGGAHESGFSPPPELADSPPIRAAPAGPLAPMLGTPLTLGEASLGSVSNDETPRKSKAIIAVIVRAAPGYRLLP